MILRLLFTLVLSLPFTAKADSDAAESLSDLLSGIKSFSARFSQEVLDEEGNLIQDSQGEIKVKQPNKLYWLAQSPYEQLVVSNGTVLWQYDADLEQATRYRASEKVSAIPALLLSGQVSEVKTLYTISRLDSENPKQYKFQLEPKDSQNLFDVLQLTLSESSVIGMSFVDSFAQKTEIVFSDVKPNPSIDDSIFEFEPPAGTDVIIDE